MNEKIKNQGFSKLNQAWLAEVDEQTWIISDTHFNHARILTYEPARVAAMQAQGFESMDEWMIANWNRVVGKHDLVLHLGDFAFKTMREFMNRLNGRIILLLGNHDIPMLNQLEHYAQAHPDKLFIHQVCEGLSEPVEASGLIRIIGAKKVMFSHYPLISDDPYLRGKAKITRDAMAQVFRQHDCELNVHGHVHSNDAQLAANEINVSIERIGFAPKRLCEVLPHLQGASA